MDHPLFPPPPPTPEEQATSIIVDCTTRQAWALAQLVKRITWSSIESHAFDREEAEVMRDALERLRRGLADSGFSPR